MHGRGAHIWLALWLACWLLCVPLVHAEVLDAASFEEMARQLARPELSQQTMRRLVLSLQQATLVRCERDDCKLAEHQRMRTASAHLLAELARAMRRYPALALDISKTVRSWRYVRPEHRGQGSRGRGQGSGGREKSVKARTVRPKQVKTLVSTPVVAYRAAFATTKNISLDMHRTGANRRTEQSMLLQQAIDLHLATSKDGVSRVLERLKHANITVFGVPCEDLYCQNQRPAVYAATMDTLLAELASAVHRWPSLAHRIGQTVLSWQYCDIRYRNRSRDLFVRGGQRLRRMASTPSPAHQQGWRRWGFDTQDDGRLIPEPLWHHGLSGNAKAAFLYRYVDQRCFPDPETGRTPYDITEPMYAGPQHDFPDKPGRDYPYQQQWLDALRQQAGTAKPIPSVPKKTPPPAVPPLPTQRSYQARQLAGKTRAVQTSSIPPASAPGLVKSKAHMLAVKHGNTPHNSGVLPLPVSRGASGRAVPFQKLPLPSSTPQQHQKNEQINQGMKAASTRPVQASVYNKWKMGDRQQEIGLGVFWSPFDYFYVRGSISGRIPAWGRNPGYSWGAGYNDWHPGGLMIEFNQWKAQQFGRNTNIRNAEFNLGYRIPFPKSIRPYIDGTINARMVGKTPNIGGLCNLRYKSYFVRFGINKDLRGPNGWQWVYGVGRWNWQAGSLNIEYDNWGGNRVFTPNFRRNGELLMEYRFDF